MNDKWIGNPQLAVSVSARWYEYMANSVCENAFVRWPAVIIISDTKCNQFMSSTINCKFAIGQQSECRPMALVALSSTIRAHARIHGMKNWFDKVWKRPKFDEPYSICRRTVIRNLTNFIFYERCHLIQNVGYCKSNGETTFVLNSEHGFAEIMRAT